MPPPPVTLTFDLLTLKVVSESRVTWATSVSILVFLCLSVPNLGPMFATDRRETRINAYGGRGIIMWANATNSVRTFSIYMSGLHV